MEKEGEEKSLDVQSSVILITKKRKSKKEDPVINAGIFLTLFGIILMLNYPICSTF